MSEKTCAAFVILRNERIINTMAENDMDSGQSNGTPASPNTGSSDGNGDSKSSFDASKLQSAFEALTKRLDEVDARSKSLQGDKDRGVNKAQEEVKELKRKIAEIEKLKGTGLDMDGAIEEYNFREDVRTIKDQLSKLGSAQTSPAGNGVNLVDEQAKVFEEYELNPNDPEAVSLLELRGTELIKAVSKLAIKKAKSTPPDSSEAPTLQGGVSAKKDDAQLIARLRTLQSNPAKNQKEIKELENKLGW